MKNSAPDRLIGIKTIGLFFAKKPIVSNVKGTLRKGKEDIKIVCARIRKKKGESKMHWILSIGIDVVSAAVFFVPIMAVLQFTVWRKMKTVKKVGIMLFGLYLAAVFSAVGMPSVNYLRLDMSFNWIPIIDIASDVAGYLKNTALNILLFVPAGFLMPVIWTEFRSLRKTAAFGIGLSLAIEILQLFTFRLTDVDDLIMNTAGAVIGYFIAEKLDKRAGGKLYKAVGDKGGMREAPAVTFTVFLIAFFLQPFISPILWSLVIL